MNALGRILARIQAAGIAYRSLPHGTDDYTVNPAFGGNLVYWSQPDGHVWELLTVSYERQPLGRVAVPAALETIGRASHPRAKA